MGLILSIILIVLLLDELPTWRYSRNWGYDPTHPLWLLNREQSR